MRMRKTRVFKSGNSWAVRLPKDFHFESGPVLIFWQGNDLIIRKKPTNLGEAFRLLTELPGDFMPEGRNDLPPQERNFKWD